MEHEPPNISPIKAIHDLARRNKIVAEYKLEKESGPAHAKTYTIRLHFGDKEYVGIDRSIKLAQRAAAQTALDEHKDLLSMNNNSNKQNNTSQSPTVALNTWAAQHHIPTRYVLLYQQYLPSSIHSSWNRPQYIFHYRLYFGQDLCFDGHGSSHQQARIDCALHALNYIRQNENTPIMSLPSTTTQTQPKSPISLMYERAKQLGLTVQIEQNDALIITYRIGEQYSTTGTGQTKHEAKQKAAEKMLEILPLPVEEEKQKHNRKRSNQHKKFILQRGSSDYSLSEEINPITRVYQIARAQNIKVEFLELDHNETEKLFHFRINFGENDSADGYGKNKQAAKRSAAECLLSKLNSEFLGSVTTLPSSLKATPPVKGLLKHDEHSNKQHEKKHVHFAEEQIIQHERDTTSHQLSITIKQQLINACQKLNIDIQYEDEILPNNNNNNQHQSILSLSKDQRLLAQFRGNGASLIRAQENVSLTAWKNLKQLFNGSVQIPKAAIKKRYRQLATPTPVEEQ